MLIDVFLFFGLPAIFFIALSFLGGFLIGNTLWAIYGYWYIDSLIDSEYSYWFKGTSVALVLILNSLNYKDSLNASKSYASGCFSLGFLVGIVKYFFS
jgi:hypothetical protein